MSDSNEENEDGLSPREEIMSIFFSTLVRSMTGNELRRVRKLCKKIGMDDEANQFLFNEVNNRIKGK